MKSQNFTINNFTFENQKVLKTLVQFLSYYPPTVNLYEDEAQTDQSKKNKQKNVTQRMKSKVSIH